MVTYIKCGTKELKIVTVTENKMGLGFDAYTIQCQLQKLLRLEYNIANSL